jgi:1-deoxy-D-xylulose-5-phosphate synthase
MSKLLDEIDLPQDLRKIDIKDLSLLCNELRDEVISIVSQTGGHLGASLGVIELTVALHYVFDTPNDLLVWDIGHQSYPHKILTGRKNKMHTLRKPGGISGFTKKSESIYDCWGAGHCSTSISAAVGMATALKYKGNHQKVIGVIGDGALSAGMAYEALNNASKLDQNLIIILNDNEMSISPAVGAMSHYLTKLFFSRPLLRARDFAKKSLNLLPKTVGNIIKKTLKHTKGAVLGGNFFEELGMNYIGPIDGHNIEDLVTIFNKVKNEINGKPILIHIKTEKGKGFSSIDTSGEKYHAINTFDLITKKQLVNTNSNPTYSKIFGSTLSQLADEDSKIIAITAAMCSGTGLVDFQKKHPDRLYDVGIAEQHAVTFAAGLACQGMKPFVAIYSTFLQRAYDQVIHDVAIQNLPVRFIIDRAGQVGADGATHAGSFDLTYLATVPNMVIMAPSNDLELVNMIATAALYEEGPIAVRFPRSSSKSSIIPAISQTLEIGKGEVITHGNMVAILSLGTRLSSAIKAQETLAKLGINPTIVNMRFAKPIDLQLVLALCKTHQLFITIEEGSIGGFSAQVFDCLQKANINNVLLKSLYFSDQFLDQGTYDEMNRIAGVETDDIIKIVTEFLKVSNAEKSKTLELA